MKPTLEQQIAQKEAELARLREKSRALENGQKIILGGMLIKAAQKDPDICAWLLVEAERSITREVDIKRLEPLLTLLRAGRKEVVKEPVSEPLITEAGKG